MDGFTIGDRLDADALNVLRTKTASAECNPRDEGIQARQNAAVATYIDFTQLVDSARAPNWFEARCGVCGRSATGSESAVEDWANEHVATCDHALTCD
ncbi:hypothetical protein [Nocardia sp. NBC_01388]|uniref:hypothetical protein n=1 Tax=Nocardia sp. NBC_01388 TaxID=2903596 RepID=UPI003255C3D4